MSECNHEYPITACFDCGIRLDESQLQSQLTALRAQLDSARKALEDPWLPIESAPKDGTPILVLSIPYEAEFEPGSIHQFEAKAAIAKWNP